MIARPSLDTAPPAFTMTAPHLRSSVAIGAGIAIAALLAAIALIVAQPRHAPAMLAPTVENLTGANPDPVKLVRPPVQPLSALATIGERIFHDPTLSASGRQSCASCHSPAHSFGPPNDRSVQLGGPQLTSEGLRPPPSLAYLYRQAVFSIGPAAEENDTPPSFAQLAAQAQGSARATKAAGTAPAAAAIVPQGGLFWDGRADTLMSQATGPMMNPAEMANTEYRRGRAQAGRGGLYRSCSNRCSGGR